MDTVLPEEWVEATDPLDATRSPQVLRAVHELVPLLYEELRRTAHRERRRFSVGDTMATTVLVNEVYMRLASAPGFGTRSHFLAVAAIAMRRTLIETIRAQLALKRGGDHKRVPMEAAMDVEIADDERILAINDAPQELSLALAGLGERHRAYGVMAADFEPVGRALIGALGARLGEDFDGLARAAWLKVYAFVTVQMRGVEACAQH